MLGKLLKLDIMFGWKKFAAMAAAVVMTGIMLPYIRKFYVFPTWGFFVGLCLIICALCLYVCCQYFKSNLLGSEGYLMFTLPVKSGSIVLSKLITAVFWINVMFCAAGAAVVFKMQYTPAELFQIISSVDMWKRVIFMLILCNIVVIPIIASVYLAVSSRNITVKNKLLNGIIAEIIAVVGSWIAIRASFWGIELYNDSEYYMSLRIDSASKHEFMTAWMILIIGFAISMLFTAIYGILTNLIIKKRLNLK